MIKNKISNLIKKIVRLNRGMTYVEFIIVLSIMGTMSAVAIANYGTFQKKMEIRNLANQIALKIVEAQKSAMSGRLPSQVLGEGMVPAYGIYLESNAQNNKKIFYFSDLNNDYICNEDSIGGCSPSLGNGIKSFDMTNNVYISSLKANDIEIPKLSVVFKRPDSSARIATNNIPLGGTNTAEITISSTGSSVTSKIRVLTSGVIKID